MFAIEITFPPTNIKTSPVFKRTYRSLRHASIKLDVSYYFLYNCYHQQHNNQFTRFFKIYRVDQKGNRLNYRSPKKKNKKKHGLKQLLIKKRIVNKKQKRNETETETKIDKTQQDGDGQRCGDDEKHNGKDDDTKQYVSKTSRSNQWKLWSFDG